MSLLLKRIADGEHVSEINVRIFHIRETRILSAISFKIQCALACVFYLFDAEKSDLIGNHLTCIIINYYYYFVIIIIINTFIIV